ncbi:hypothetical protein BDN70DRAFT_925572 [Pholiota conissans]|uniref:F-box domain-containing protein n=1 Tax=Pholiota conissans TaxID=109636 RepID=A0A9P6CUK7_9AGAR|nr:hypothetical protein BDN70DRAFT_925572 [Pholiota conissans]
MSDLCKSCNFLVEDEFHCDPKDPNACSACRKLAELDAKYRTVIAELRIERSKLKEEVNRNHSKLIQRFPPEILSHVFKLCLPEDPMNIEFWGDRVVDNYTICTPLILSGACRWWRSVAYSTPQLWSTILIPFFHKDTDSYDRDITDTFPPLPLPIVVKQWLDRAGNLPLSINVFEAPGNHGWNRKQQKIIVQIIEQLNLKCSRWQKLKFCGLPDNLELFSWSDATLPQLRMLDLSLYFEGDSVNFKIYAAGLKMLSIKNISLKVLNFDWSNLTELSMVGQPLSDCLDALQRAPGLLQFIARDLASPHRGVMPPQSPIILPNITFLEIDDSSSRFLENVTFASLKTLVLKGYLKKDINVVFAFLKRSECSLEQLSLGLALERSHLISLFQDMPTLRHLTFNFIGRYHKVYDYSSDVLDLLADFSTVNGSIVPRYLPHLNSLTLISKHDPNWTKLPKIFGKSHKRIIERHRLSLESILVKTGTYGLYHRIDKKHMERILWIRDCFGVKWRIIFGEQGKLLEPLLNYYAVQRPFSLLPLVGQNLFRQLLPNDSEASDPTFNAAFMFNY